MHTHLLAARRAAREHQSRVLSNCRWYFPAESSLDLPELHGLERDPNDGSIDLDEYAAIAIDRLTSRRLH
jgi:hypothetical protein